MTAEELADRFPDIGLFVAEDIIDARRKNDGVFPDEGALVALGVTAELAHQILVAVVTAPTEIEPTKAADGFDVAPPSRVVDEPRVEEVIGESAPPPARIAAVANPVVESAPRVATRVEFAPPAHAESAPPAAPSTPPTRTRRWPLVAATAVFVLCVGAAAYFQESRTRKTVVSISADVDVVKVEQAAAKERADETMAKLEETRARLDEQAKSLAHTKARMAAAEARLQENERTAKEHEAREDKETAALANRVIRVEQKTYKLDEALKMIDNFDR